MPVAEHLVASTRHRVRTLTSYEHGTWLWAHILAALPDALSLVLMLDHIHLMARPGSEATLRRVLSAFTAVFGIRFDLCPAQPSNTMAIAARQVRYGFNNPVRAGFVDDPWKWPWSTLRDLGQAAFPTHHRLEQLAAFLRLSPPVTLRGLTSSALGKFPAPHRLTPEVASLDDIIASVAAAIRMPTARILDARLGRRLLVQACAELRQPPPANLIAARIGMDPRSVRRLRAPRHPAVDTVLTCLADPRLRAWPIVAAAERPDPASQ